MPPTEEQTIMFLSDDAAKTSEWRNTTFKEQWLYLKGSQGFREQKAT